MKKFEKKNFFFFFSTDSELKESNIDDIRLLLITIISTLYL